MLTTAIAMPVMAQPLEAQNRSVSMPQLSPTQIAQDVAREHDIRTGQAQWVAPSFDPFEEDAAMAGSASLRSAGSVTTIDGQTMRGGAVLDLGFYYNSAGSDPYDIKGFSDAVFLSGEPAMAVRRDNRVLECSTHVRETVYDHRSYYSPGLSLSFYRPHRFYHGHFGYNYPSYHGYSGAYGYGRAYRPRIGSRHYGSGRVRGDRRNRDHHYRDGRRDRDGRNSDRRRDVRVDPPAVLTRQERQRRQRNRQVSGDSLRHDPGSYRRFTREQRFELAPRQTREDSRPERNRAVRQTRERRLEPASVEPIRSETRTGEAANLNRVPTRMATPSPRMFHGAPGIKRRVKSPKAPVHTPKAERRESNNSSRNSSNRSNRSKAPRSKQSRAKPPKQRSERSFNRQKGNKKLNFFPGNYHDGYGGRDVVTRVDVDCAREERLSLYIPEERLAAARFDGLTILALDRDGREYPIFVPPNYIEGFRLAKGQSSTQPHSYEPHGSAAPAEYSPLPVDPTVPINCPEGTVPEPGGTCLLTGEGYP